MDNKPQVIVEPPPAPIVKTFHQQAFGPWVSNDNRIQQQIARTQTSAGSAQRRFQATYPPAPTVAEKATAITGGFEFTINLVSSPNVTGYNIYSSPTNNPNIATLIQYQQQPPLTSLSKSLKIQDITAATPFYWVATVNNAGKESARIPMTGVAAPMPPPTSPIPPGGSSGGGSSGGGGRGGRLTQLR